MLRFANRNNGRVSKGSAAFRTCLLAAVTAGMLLAQPALAQPATSTSSPRAKAPVVAKLPLARLAMKPVHGAPGTTLLITGIPFGSERRGRHLVLESASSMAKPSRVELEVVSWESQRVQARIPRVVKVEGTRFTLALLDPSGNPLARSGEMFTLTREVAAGAGASGTEHRTPGLAGRVPGAGTLPGKLPDATAGTPTVDGQAAKDPGGARPWPDDRRQRDTDRVKRRPDQTGTPDPRGADSPATNPSGKSFDKDALPPWPGGDQSDPQAEDRRREMEERRARSQTGRVALVLQGGGALGAFQVGVLKNLYARGLTPIIITGTSVGALNAAKLAEGRGADGVADLERLWRSLGGSQSIYEDNPQFSDVADDTIDEWKSWFTDMAVSFLAGSPFLPVYLADHPSFAGSVEEVVGDIDAIESLKIQNPLVDRVAEHIRPDLVACSGIKLRLGTVTRDSGEVRFMTERGDIETEDGRLVRRGRLDPGFLRREHEPDDPCPVPDGRIIDKFGDCMTAPNVADGVLASSAIPLFFKPWLMEGGEYYWDGAVRENAPVRKALDLGATDVVVVLTGPAPWAHRTSFGPSAYALVVERLHQIDNPDGFTGKKGDYRAEVKVGDGDWVGPHFREDDPDIFPRWSFYPVNGDISLRVWDEEDNPDRCDAGPTAGLRDLLIHFDGQRITGDVQGVVGDLLHATGSGDDNRVETWFRIVGYSSSDAAYLGGNPLLSLTPIRRAMQLLGQMNNEVNEGDLDILDTLDTLHEIAASVGEGAVTSAVRTFPLPRDIDGNAYALPNYTVIDAPLVMSDLLDFGSSPIDLNIEIGELTAKYTRVDFLDILPAPREGGQFVNPTQDPELSDERLEQLKRSDILVLLNARVEAIREFAESEPELPPHSDNWDINRRKGWLQLQGRLRENSKEFADQIEQEYERLQDRPITPPRTSRHSGRIQDLGAPRPLPDPGDCLRELSQWLNPRPAPAGECQVLSARIARLVEQLASWQRQLAGASPAKKPAIVARIQELDRELDEARDEHARRCRG